ncbi:hypothetical protein DSM25558_2900 [Agrobacterium sp. DSM 25558]|nr:hypothetical protein DSM25558_2900 [Agrobacterium sp. DSM 25558]
MLRTGRSNRRSLATWSPHALLKSAESTIKFVLPEGIKLRWIVFVGLPEVLVDLKGKLVEKRKVSSFRNSSATKENSVAGKHRLNELVWNFGLAVYELQDTLRQKFQGVAKSYKPSACSAAPAVGAY